MGNVIEWYEFGVYGRFATIIAARFSTPEGGGETEGPVKRYASCALAFFFRPVGGRFSADSATASGGVRYWSW